MIISCRGPSDKCVNGSILHASSPFYTPFYQFPLHSSLLLLPQHIPSSACIALLTLFHLHSPSGLQIQVCLRLLDSPRTTVTGQVYFLSSSPLCLSVRFVPLHLLVYFFHLFLLSLLCIEKVLNHTSLKEKMLSSPIHT